MPPIVMLVQQWSKQFWTGREQCFNACLSRSSHPCLARNGKKRNVIQQHGTMGNGHDSKKKNFGASEGLRGQSVIGAAQLATRRNSQAQPTHHQ